MPAAVWVGMSKEAETKTAELSKVEQIKPCRKE